MLAFQRVLEQIERHGAWVVGASSDSPFVQKAWARELELDYPMFSDPQREAGRACDGLIQELSGIRDVHDRAVFIIDREGCIRYRWMARIKGQPDMEEVLRALDEVVAR